MVAARLRETPDRRVVLLESGIAWSTDSSTSGHLLSDASSLRASIDPRTSQTYPGTLIQARHWGAARG